MLSAWVALAEKCRQRLNLKLEFIVFLSSFHYFLNAGGELAEGFGACLVWLVWVLEWAVQGVGGVPGGF